MALTLLSWGLWAVLSRFIEDELSPAYCQAISTLGFAPILLALLRMKDSDAPRGDSSLGTGLALASGVVSSLGNVAYYTALETAKASTVAPLTAMSPAVTILLAVLLLRERVGLLQWLGMAVSLGAIYLLNFSGEEGLEAEWIRYALIPLVLWGVTLLLQKMATDRISGKWAAFWFLVAFIPLAVWVILTQPLPDQISPRAWCVAIAMGFALGFGNLTIMWALSSGGKASIVAPLSGLYPLVSLPIAILLLGERLNAREIAGVACAMIAVYLLSTQASAPAETPTARPTA